MTQPGSRVDYASMTRMSQTFDARADGMVTEAAAVDELRNVVWSAYQSNASTTFNKAIEAWLANFNVVIQGARTMSAELAAANSDYVATQSDAEQNAATLTTSLQGALEGYRV